MGFTMKVVLLLLLLCLAEAEDQHADTASRLNATEAKLEELQTRLDEQTADTASRLNATEAFLEELQTRLNEQTADTASRLDATEAKLEELQTRLSESEKLHKHKTDTASRLDATEAKLEELQTRQSESEKLQKQKTDQLQSRFHQFQTSFDQLQDRLKQLTKEQDCLKKKLCEQHGFTFSNGLCYYISTETNTWAESRQWCRDRNSDLMIIKSKEKQDFVASFNKRVWLGLTDREREGSFQWVDGTPLTTPTFWQPSEPAHETFQYTNAVSDCVEYYDGFSSASTHKGWNDVTCTNSRYWMCERVLC